MTVSIQPLSAAAVPVAPVLETSSLRVNVADTLQDEVPIAVPVSSSPCAPSLNTLYTESLSEPALQPVPSAPYIPTATVALNYLCATDYSEKLRGLQMLTDIRDWQQTDIHAICSACEASNTQISPGMKMQMMTLLKTAVVHLTDADPTLSIQPYTHPPSYLARIQSTFESCRQALQTCPLNSDNFKVFQERIAQPISEIERQFLQTLVQELAPRFEQVFEYVLDQTINRTEPDRESIQEIFKDRHALYCSRATVAEMLALFKGMREGLPRRDRPEIELENNRFMEDLRFMENHFHNFEFVRHSRPPYLSYAFQADDQYGPCRTFEDPPTVYQASNPDLSTPD